MSVWSFFLTPSAFRRSFALRVSDAQHEHSMKLAVLVAVAKLWARQELYSTDCLLDASRSLICCRQLSDLLYIGFLLQNTIPDIFRYPPLDLNPNPNPSSRSCSASITIPHVTKRKSGYYAAIWVAKCSSPGGARGRGMRLCSAVQHPFHLWLFEWWRHCIRSI